MGIPDHLTCLLRKLHACQEATVRTGPGTMDWFEIGKRVQQDCILSPCLFNLYAEYIMWNAGLDEAQAGIKSVERNVNNLRYADDTTLMTESKEELKNLLMKVKEESGKAGINQNIQKHEYYGIWSHPFMANRWGKQWKQWHTLFSWAPKSLHMVTAAVKLKHAFFLEIKRCLLLGRASLISQLLKFPPATWETLVQFLDWEDPLEKGQATHSSVLGLPLWLSW